MKQIYLLVLISVASVANSQIQITQANMPSLNDTIRYSNAGAGSFDFKATGVNYNWDFSALGMTNQDIYSFKSLLSAYPTLVLNGMPIGAFGYKVADSIGAGPLAFKNVYNFYEKKSTAWLGVGTAFSIPLMGNPVPVGAVYSDKDEIYTFPLKYNDQDSTTFHVTTPLGLSQSISFGSFTQKGYRINKVEGYGTISTPYASNISCIKVKSRIVENDSLALAIPLQPGINVGFPVIRVEYKWLSTTEKIPMLEVTGTELAGVFTPAVIRYRDKYRGPSQSPFAPKVKFSVDKNSGKTTKDTFTLINNTTPTIGTSYLWTISPSLGSRFVKSTGNTSVNPILVFDSAGVFSVNLKATNLAGSSDSTATNMITIIKDNSSVQDISKDNILFYPNPVSGMLNFYAPELAGKTCRIFDVSGRLVSESLIDNTLALDCRTLDKGIYTLIISDHHTLIYKQFIKE